MLLCGFNSFCLLKTYNIPAGITFDISSAPMKVTEPISRVEKLGFRILAGRFLLQAYYDVKFRPYSDWSVALKTVEPQRSLTLDEVQRAAYLCAVTRRISRVFDNRISCIVRTIGAKKLLASQGIESEVILGVPKAGVLHQKGWQAHAWLVVGGRVMIGGRESGLYEPLKKKPESFPEK